MGLFGGLDRAMTSDDSGENVEKTTPVWFVGPCEKCDLGGQFEGTDKCPRCEAMQLRLEATDLRCKGNVEEAVKLEADALKKEGEVYRYLQQCSPVSFIVTPYWKPDEKWHCKVDTFSLASAAEHAHSRRLQSMSGDMLVAPHTEERCSLQFGTYDWRVMCALTGEKWMVTTRHDEESGGYKTVAIVKL